jgi:DNA-directed RNA polymerase subunit RPC12/RpoP
MGIYNFYKCPRCGRNLFEFVPAGAKGVAAPIRDCAECGAIVDVRQLYNEWELMTDRERASMQRRVTWTAAQIGGLWGALPPLIFASWIFDKLGIVGESFEDLGPPWLGMTAAGWMIGFFIHRGILQRQLSEAIAGSETRMKDPQYRSKLKSAGLIPGSP